MVEAVFAKLIERTVGILKQLTIYSKKIIVTV
jgi:hypothetical protein